MTLLYILLASLTVSTVSLIGVGTLLLSKIDFHRIVLLLVSLAAGTLMGGAFLHLLPESVEALGVELPFVFTLIAFVIFFIIEKFLHWRHCHDEDCEVHSYGYLNLAGDAIHNFIDGVIIAVSFLAGFEVGVAATLAIMLHEIPQEVGDLGVLLHAGFKRSQALLANFLTALTALVGALVGYSLSAHVEGFIPFLLAAAAGGFIYIGSADLMPQLMKEKEGNKSILSFSFFVFGILIMYFMKFFVHEG